MLASEQTISGVNTQENCGIIQSVRRVGTASPKPVQLLSGGKTGLSWMASSTPTPGLVSTSAGLELLLHEGGALAPTSRMERGSGPCG